MSSIFVPRNPIETAKEFQWEIDRVHPEVAEELAQQARDVIGDVTEIYGTNKLIIHTLGALILNRGLTIDEQIIGYQFNDEMIIRGHFGGLPFVRKFQNPRIQSFVADMYDVEILEPRVSENPTGKIKPPLMLPVLSIETVLAAA